MTTQSGLVPVSDTLHRHAAWFVHYARQCNGRILLKEVWPIFELQCDACPEGGGGFSSQYYYSCQYPPSLSKEHHISQKEPLNNVLALKSLTPSDLRCAEVVITTNNSAEMHTLNTGKTKDPVLAACSRELWLFAALRELTITVNHAPGATLVLSDALSRRHQGKELGKEDIVLQMTRHLKLSQITPCDINHVLAPEL